MSLTEPPAALKETLVSAKAVQGVHIEIHLVSLKDIGNFLSHRKTRSHNAATNCYTFIYTLAGKLFCQLWATRVNFFAASRSALVILPGKNTEVPRGEDPTLRERSTTGWIDDPDARLRRFRHLSL